jgi:ABC-2 type transport system permease protein
VSLNNDKVMENDSARHLPDNPYAILLDITSNKIIPDSFSMILANSRSINTLKNEKEYITVTPLMSTSSKAVGEQIDKSVGKDLPGPLNLAVAAENNGGEHASKILVIGNGFFVSESGKQQYGPYFSNGMYFFLNSLSWMQNKKDDLTIQPKSYDPAKLTINAMQANITGILTVIILPLLILGIGMVVWSRRRHL